MPLLIEQCEKFDAIICDLPYGTTACSWDSVIPFEPLWECYKRLINPNVAIVLFGSQPFTSDLVMSNRKWFKYEWVWEKTQATGHLDANRRPMKTHESIVVFSEGTTKYFPQMQIKDPGNIRQTNKRRSNGGCYGDFRGNAPRRVPVNVGYPKSVIKFPNVNTLHSVGHSTVKPIALLEYLIKTYTNVGDRILDNTAGSFTAGVAAIRTGRYCVGIEKEEKYCQISAKRILEAQQEIDSMLIKPWEIEANPKSREYEQTSIFDTLENVG